MYLIKNVHGGNATLSNGKLLHFQPTYVTLLILLRYQPTRSSERLFLFVYSMGARRPPPGSDLESICNYYQPLFGRHPVMMLQLR